jgi:hypothetical protein
MAAVLCLVSGRNSGNLNRHSRSVGQQRPMFLYYVQHTNAHVAEASYADAQLVSHNIRRVFQMKCGLSYA